MNTGFAIGQEFMKDGKPVKIISGALHYFRVVPQYWRDRLEKLLAMGCNTVETYLPWNLHEPRKGEYCFEGLADVEAFIRLAGEMGLMVIARPGPYICAEWEFGGLPAWLLAEDGMRLRTLHPGFMKHLAEYFAVLLPRLAPLQAGSGGPIVLFQVENEYGYYGDDAAYLLAVKQLLRQNGVTVPLITSDGPNGDSLACGSIPGALPTANFGSRANEQSPLLEKHLASKSWMENGQTGGPEMVTEFWVGWFDYWGSGYHSIAPAETNAADLDVILSRGSVNFYMWHGGTNFGFMNGSNYYEELTPDVTSYDYDAPLSEDGRITPKYEALRDIIAKHAEIPQVQLSTVIERKAYGKVEVQEKTTLFATLEQLVTPTENPWPLCMEKLGQGYGYTLYTSRISKGDKIEKFRLARANDRAQVFVDEALSLTLYDRELLDEREVDWPVGDGFDLAVLVENMGRVNFGVYLDSQRKGIDGGVLVNAHSHYGWECWPLQLDAAMLARVDYGKGWEEGKPAFYRMAFVVDQPADTYVDMEGWGKGCVFINGFNLGRYWEVGPQKRLYLPGPLLKAGENELVIFETEGKAPGCVTLRDEPELGRPELAK